MPRPPREEVPGGFFHIAARAVDGADVFHEVHDRLSLLALLHGVAQRYEWRCQAYCLMCTHFHLIVQTMKPTLARGMQALCGVYGLRFNKRYERRGHLFGSRYMSVAITSDAHLLEAHRYVARNPVRAGLCSQPGDWRWAATARSSTWREPSPSWTSGACFDSSMIGPPWHGSSSAATSRLTGQNHRLPTSWPEWTGSDPVRIELVPAVLGCCSQSR